MSEETITLPKTDDEETCPRGLSSFSLYKQKGFLQFSPQLSMFEGSSKYLFVYARIKGQDAFMTWLNWNSSKIYGPFLLDENYLLLRNKSKMFSSNVWIPISDFNLDRFVDFLDRLVKPPPVTFLLAGVERVEDGNDIFIRPLTPEEKCVCLPYFLNENRKFAFL